MAKTLSTRAAGLAPVVLPLAAILAARMATYSDIAAQYATLAALLFAWVAADALALAVIAKAPDRKPGLRAMLGAVALGLLVAFVGAAAPVREAMLAMPPLVIALVGTAGVYLVWSGSKAILTWRSTRSAQAALAQVVPAKLAHLLLGELEMLRIAFLSWGASPDVPEGMRGFAYHRYLTPMLATMLVLQLIEIAVVHLVVSHFSETAALVLLAVSVWGTIWLVALMKSFRLFPVLLSEQRLRVRSARIVDLTVNLDDIAEITGNLPAERLAAKSTLNLAILSSPNCCILLKQPVEQRTVLGGVRKVDAIGLRLDESGEFHAALQELLDRR